MESYDVPLSWFLSNKAGSSTIEFSFLFENGKRIRNCQVRQGDFKAMVVRDPIDRLQSCFPFKRKAHIAECMGFVPTLDEFIEWLEGPGLHMDRHWRPQIDFLPDAATVNVVAPLRCLESVVDIVCIRFQLQRKPLVWENKGMEPKPHISKSQRDKLERIYAEDIDFFKQIDASWK